MRLRTTKELPCQAWTVALSSLLISVAGLTQVSVSVWLFIYTSNFVPIIGDPIRNAFIGCMALGSFGFLTAAFGACCAVMRNKIGLILYGGFLVAAMVCQAALWTFVYLEERNITTMSEALQRRIMQNSDTVGEVLNDKFLCRLENFNNEVEELEICGETFSKWVNTISAVLWGLSAVSLCIEFVTLVMVTMLTKLIYDVERRDKVEVFYDAQVIEHPQPEEEQKNEGQRNEELQKNGGQRNGELQRNGQGQRNQGGQRNGELHRNGGQRNGGQRNGGQRNQGGQSNGELHRNGGQRNGGQRNQGGQRNPGGQRNGGQRERHQSSVVDLDNVSIYDHLGHIEVNRHCIEQDQESIWL